VPAPRAFVQYARLAANAAMECGRHYVLNMALSRTPQSLRYLARRVVVALGAVGLIAVFFAPMASAVEPPSPALTGTNPPSPNVSTTPRIYGQADGVITLALPASVGNQGPITSAANPSFMITIYTDPNCTGPVAATGTSAELEGPGIQVTVAPDSITTFYATQTDPADPANPSVCSVPGLTYRQATPPNPPTLTSVTPASPANNNSPNVIGNADPGTTVAIYTDPSCSTSPVGSGTDVDFAGAGIPVSVPDNSTTTFYAIATLNGVASACSTSSISYQEVTPTDPGGGGFPDPGAPPPSPPKLRTIPGPRANDNTPLVTGTAPGAATVKIFDNAGCNGAPVAKGSAAQFASGLQVSVPDNTTTSFYGIAIGSNGSSSSCSPNPAVYIEDSTPPQTRITLGPGVKTRSRSPMFRFADITDETGTAFLCKLDRRGWQPCQAPWRAPRLRLRVHTLKVTAIDAAGNQESTGTKRRFKVVGRR
jgi:hypothetical protein